MSIPGVSRLSVARELLPAKYFLDGRIFVCRNNASQNIVAKLLGAAFIVRDGSGACLSLGGTKTLRRNSQNESSSFSSRSLSDQL
jgi:hypothetical protein